MPETHLLQRARIRSELELNDQLNAALVAHGEWKFRLAKGIETGCKHLEPDKIRTDNQCVFGKWLYSDATAPHRSSSHYEEVRKLHAEFHREAAAVVELCHRGQIDSAKQALEGSYATISNRLVEAVRAWLREFLLGQAAHAKTDTAELEAGDRTIKHYSRRGALLGTLSGFGFVLISLALVFVREELPLSVQGIAAAHAKNWAQWVVDCAPFVLGATGYYLGQLWGRVRTEKARLENSVMSRTEQLLASQREMQMMRDALPEGVFFLSREKRLGSEFSAALKEIFELNELEGLNLIDIFRSRVDETTAKELDGYLDLLFDKSHSESMLEPLNPMNPLVLPAGAGVDEKILRVVFRRILTPQGEIAGLLGIASDITQQVNAEREAERQREAANRQLELIGRILETGPQMLQLFRAQVDRSLARVTTNLRDASGQNLQQLIDTIYRDIHTIKGSAALLKLDGIARIAHEYEDELSKLRQKPDLQPADFLPLSVRHSKLDAAVREFEALIERIRQFQLTQERGADEKALLVELIRRTTEAIAQETGKSLEFVLEDPEELELPPDLFEPLRAILVQLVRNSAAHGIEPADMREAAGKSRSGKITLTLGTAGGALKIAYRDDGAGIDVEKVKRRALEKGLISPDEAGRLTNEQAYKLLFRAGFSTADATSMTAGRGVGLDIILSEVRGHGGKLALRSHPGRGTEFIMTFPAKAG
ncbi:MAG: hypothetical protein OHK0011_25280 [Turneriella sp.]